MRQRERDTILVGERETENRGHGFEINSENISSESDREILERERGVG